MKFTKDEIEYCKQDVEMIHKAYEEGLLVSTADISETGEDMSAKVTGILDGDSLYITSVNIIPTNDQVKELGERAFEVAEGFKPTFFMIQVLCSYKQKRKLVEGVTCKSVHRTDMLPDCCETGCPYMNGVELP